MKHYNLVMPNGEVCDHLNVAPDMMYFLSIVVKRWRETGYTGIKAVEVKQA